jgi:PAS domain S-box-containing protein
VNGALIESERRHRRLLELSPAAIVVQSAGKIVYANQAAVKIAGATELKQVLGKSVLDFVPPEMHEEIIVRMMNTELGGERVPLVEEKLRRLDGSIVDVEVSVDLINYLGETAIQVAMLDVTDRKATERALEESERRYRHIVEKASDVAYVTDIQGTFTYVSPSAQGMTGRDPSDLVGKHCTEIIPESWQPKVMNFYRKQFSDRIPETTLEFPILTHEEDEIWVEQTTTLLGNGKRIRGFQSIAREITKRKQAERLMLESEERYRSLFKATFEAILIHDQGEIVEVNRSFERMFLYPRDEVIGRSILSLGPSEMHPIVMEKLRNGAEEPYEATGLKKDGSTFQCELHAKQISYRGKPMRVVAIRDITEHKKAQKAERDQRRFAEALARTAALLNRSLELEEVLDHILLNVGNVVPHQVADIMLLDGNQTRVVRSLGYGAYGVTEEALRQVCLTLDNTPNFRMMAESRQPMVIPDVRNDPEWVEVPPSNWIRSYVGAPICLAGEVIGFLNLDADAVDFYQQEDANRLQAFADQAAVAIQNARLFDVSRRHAEQLERSVADRTRELQAANEHLRELGRVKDEFVSNVSHELRTPITNIKLYHGLLTINPVRQQAYIDTLQRETERLENIVEDLLYLSRLDQGTSEPVLLPEHIGRLAETYVQDRSSLAQSKGLDLQYEGEREIPAVLVDQMQLGKALSILLTNALNYTPSGGKVRVQTGTREKDGERWVTLRVRDNGPGIPFEEQAGIFKRFNRGKVGRDSGAPGTGLGLAIAKEIVEKHTGRIELASTGSIERGTQFTIWLPVHKV